jgi:hypothetical protein
MTVPKNVLRFEVLAYLSLLLDAFSAAFLDNGHLDSLGAGEQTGVAVFAVIIVVALCSLIHLAARKRKNWARWAFLALQVLSALSSLGADGPNGLAPDTIADVLSTACVATGLYFSFTGDAKGWFNA